MKDNWFIFNDKISLSKVLAQEILIIAKKSIAKKSCFSIVLTGGQSVIDLYEILSKANSNWEKWHIYISDERFSPKNHKDRNDRIINEIWLSNNLIPKKNIHFIQAEKGLIEAQKEYENILRKIDKFDVVLLSIGEDGHISSLFPEHEYPKNQDVIIERNSPKPPKERISMSYKRLNNTFNVFKIIVGESKHLIVKSLVEGKEVLANVITGEKEKIFICNNSMYSGPHK
jgi:6-phosphogluconolactonase